MNWVRCIILLAVASACGESTMIDEVPLAKSWEAPLLIESVSHPAILGDVALYDSGEALVVWGATLGFELSDIRASRYSPAMGWSETAVLSEPSAWSYSSALASSSPDSAVAVWQSVDRATSPGEHVYASTYLPTSGWSPQILLSVPDEGTEPPEVFGSPDGSVIAIWEQVETSGFQEIYQARFQPGVGWDATTPIEDANESVKGPRIVGNAAGASIAFWFRDNWPDEYELVASAYRPTTGWGPVTAMSSLDSPITLFDIASDPEEGAVGSFAQNNGSYSDLFAVDYSISSGWSTPVSIGGENSSPQGVAVASSGNGDAFIAWLRRTGPNTLDPNEVVVSRRTSGGAWEAPVVVSDLPGSVVFISLVANDQGGAVAAWLQDDGETNSNFAAVFNPGTGWSTPEPLEEENGPPSRRYEAYMPRLAINSSGDVMAAWTQYDGSSHSVYAAMYR